MPQPTSKHEDQSSLLVTLKLDDQAFAHLDALRRLNFPPQRNIVPAHVTLFHFLPAGRADFVFQTVRTAAETSTQFPVCFAKPRFLGHGVALEVASDTLVKLRDQLAGEWSEMLRPQDRRAYRPHLTIQNKVAPDEARALFEQMVFEWDGYTATATGLLVWRYRNGPWELAQESLFEVRSPSKSE